MRVIERRDIFDERVLEVEIVSVMYALQPGCQSVQIESDDVSLPLVRRVILGVHAGELSEIRIPLVLRERFLCPWNGTRDRQQHCGDRDSAHNGLPDSIDQITSRSAEDLFPADPLPVVLSLWCATLSRSDAV